MPNYNSTKEDVTTESRQILLDRTEKVFRFTIILKIFKLINRMLALIWNVFATE